MTQVVLLGKKFKMYLTPKGGSIAEALRGMRRRPKRQSGVPSYMSQKRMGFLCHRGNWSLALLSVSLSVVPGWQRNRRPYIGGREESH